MPQSKNNKKIVIKRSIFPAITSSLLGELFAVGVLVLLIPFSQTLFPALFNILRAFGIFMFVFINVLVFVYLYNWTSSYYILTKDSVIIINTFLFRKTKKFYTLNENADIKLRQGPLGRLLDFGTIEIVGPTIEDKILLKKLNRPQKAMNSLVDLISDLKSGDVFVT